MKRILFFVLGIIGVLVQYGCTEESELTAVRINEVGDELKIGDTLKLTYSYTPTSLPVEPIAKWSSSNSIVATIDAKTGVISAKREGKSVIKLTLTYNGVELSDEKEIVVNEVFAERLYFTEEEIVIKVEEKHALKCMIEPENTSNKNLTYLTSDSKIATVTNKGEVLGVSPGETTITARILGTKLLASCKVKVMPILVESISINKDKVELKVGETDTLKVNVLPVNATYKDVIWKSSDVKIATISSDGVLQAHSVGVCGVSVVTSDGVFSDKCDVIVNPINVTGITLAETQKTVIENGEEFEIAYNVLPNNATNKKVVITSSDNNVVEVMSNNKLRPKNIGSAKITYTTEDGKYSAVAEIKVISYIDWIKNNIPSKIRVSKTGGITYLGGYMTFNGKIGVSNYADKKINVTGLSFYETTNSSLRMIGAYAQNCDIASHSSYYFGGYRFHDVYEPYVKIDFVYDGVTLSLLKRMYDL